MEEWGQIEKRIGPPIESKAEPNRKRRGALETQKGNPTESNGVSGRKPKGNPI